MVGRRGFFGRAALVAALVLSGCAAVPPAATVDRVALRDHLMGLELNSWNDMKIRNVAALRDFLADDVLLVFGDGSQQNKAAFLAMIPDFTLHSLTVIKGPEILVVSPEVATLLYTVTYRSAVKADPPATVTVASSSTYVRRNGRWLSVYYQETPAR